LSAAGLESDLNVFRVVAGATADEMERVGEEAKALGRDLTLPGVTAGDAAQTFLELSRAGLSVENSLDGARGVLQLAVAAQINFADAAQLTASALNAFGLQGEQAVEVADLLTNAANESQASISDMGIALRQSAAIADLAGFSLSETATFLTELAQAGLAGSDAGTSFRVAIQRLIAPTGAAKDALEGLNLNLRDAQGNLRPEVFFELGDALDRMGRAQADATRQLIFGNDASRAAAFFARITTKEFRNQEEALKESGSAAKVAGARNAGFAGSVENLKNQITALGIEIGELALPGLGLAADGAALFFGALATQIGESRDAIAGFADDAEQLQEFLTIINDDSGFTDFLKDAGRQAQTFGDIVDDITGANDFVDFFQRLGGETQKAAPAVKRLATEEQQLGRDVNLASDAVDEQSRALDALSAQAVRAAASVARLQGQQKGLEEQTTRARISGDEDAELALLEERRANLEAELAKQEAIIAQPGTRGEATARAAIRQRILPQLEAVNSEIENILQEQQTRAENIQRDRENAQKDQIRARNAADQDFLDTLSNRRGDAERRVSAAAETASVADDIRTQNNLQALIKQQIAKIRDRIKDEQTRKAAIRDLRIALISSRQEEDALRAQQRADAAARREEGINLDIAFAETTGNVAREIAARERLIALLRKQQKAVKKGTNEWKNLRNEIAVQQQAIKDAQKQSEDNQNTGQSAQQFFFEQLQAQQGFASNLLGNLIPRDQTAGLVGTPSPTGPSGGISLAASVQEGKSTAGVTSGQVSTTNAILQRILKQLEHLNGVDSTPEAKYQRGQGAAIMDGGGGNIVAM
jgi:TP901 family phage tail tape measure protein